MDIRQFIQAQRTRLIETEDHFRDTRPIVHRPNAPRQAAQTRPVQPSTVQAITARSKAEPLIRIAVCRALRTSWLRRRARSSRGGGILIALAVKFNSSRVRLVSVSLASASCGMGRQTSRAASPMRAVRIPLTAPSPKRAESRPISPLPTRCWITLSERARPPVTARWPITMRARQTSRAWMACRHRASRSRATCAGSARRPKGYRGRPRASPQ